MADHISTLLISGTSHTGKSTFAASIGEALGWHIQSTDKLGRHPGRPWPTVATHIAEYYSRLSDNTIYQFLLHHHQNMWPHLKRFISDHRDQDIPLVLEGSALRTEYLATLDCPKSTMVFLHADHGFLRDRMRQQSGYDQFDEAHRAMIDKFIDRSLRDNDENLAAARRHSLPCLEVSDTSAVDEFRLELTHTLSHPD